MEHATPAERSTPVDHDLRAERVHDAYPRKSRAPVYILTVAVAAVLVMAGLRWWYVSGAGSAEHQPTATGPAEQLPNVPALPAGPAIKHPMPAAAEVASSMPALGDSDSTITQGLRELFGDRAVRTLLQTDGMVRRFVATVDNLPRDHAGSQRWPVNPAGGRFQVRQQGGAEVIDPDNALRYAPFVQMVERVDVSRAVALYARHYPLFQQAYEELGYPKAYFNDRLFETLDDLLAAPEPAGPIAVRLVEVRGPIPSARPWVNYEYADPNLQALSAGQKMMVRMGPENERRLKTRLKALREALVAASTAPR